MARVRLLTRPGRNSSRLRPCAATMVSARTAFHTIAARLAVPRAASGTLLISLGIPSVTPISFVVRRIAASTTDAHSVPSLGGRISFPTSPGVVIIAATVPADGNGSTAG